MGRLNHILKALLITQTIMAGAFADRGSQTSALSTKVGLDEQQQVLGWENGLTAYVEDDKKPPPQGHQILLSVHNGLSTTPIELDVHDASLNGLSLRKALELAKVKAVELGLQQVASDIGMWIEQHPWKAAFYAASAIGFFAPEILSIPALEALGFASTGVRAGSLAAKIQSVIGPVAARSVFSIWQSARMGGYGVEYTNGGVRALIALVDAAKATCNPLKDCNGFISDGGQRALGESSGKIALAAFCGCLVVLSTVLV